MATPALTTNLPYLVKLLHQLGSWARRLLRRSTKIEVVDKIEIIRTRTKRIVRGI